MLAASISVQPTVAAAPGRSPAAGAPQNAGSPAALFAFLFAAAGEALDADAQNGAAAGTLPATPEGDSEIAGKDTLPGDRPKSRGSNRAPAAPLRTDPAALLNTIAVAPVAVPATTPEPAPAPRALELTAEAAPAPSVELPEAAAAGAAALPAPPVAAPPVIPDAAPAAAAADAAPAAAPAVAAAPVVAAAAAAAAPALAAAPAAAAPVAAAPDIAPALPQSAEPSFAPSNAAAQAPSAEPASAPFAAEAAPAQPAPQSPDMPAAHDVPRVDRRQSETPVVQFARVSRVPLEARALPRVEAAPGSPATEHPEAFSLRLRPAERSATPERIATALPATAPRPEADRADAPAAKDSTAPETSQAAAHVKPAARSGNSAADDRDRRERDDRGAGRAAADHASVAERPDAERSAAERPDAAVRPEASQSNPLRAAAPDIAAAAPRAEAPADPRPVKAPEAPSAPAPAQEVSDAKPAARPAQEIALRVGSASDSNSKVEVRVSERAGEVYVSVRTPDATLAREMRDDLGSLTGKLSQAGYETAAPTNDSSSFSRQQDRQQDASGGRQDGSPSGGSGQQHQQRQQQDDGRGRRFPWMDSFEELFSGRQPEKEDQ